MEKYKVFIFYLLSVLSHLIFWFSIFFYKELNPRYINYTICVHQLTKQTSNIQQNVSALSIVQLHG